LITFKVGDAPLTSINQISSIDISSSVVLLGRVGTE